MFCVIYEFIVDQKHEQAFKNLWHQLTLCIQQESGSLGSRLHKVVDAENIWVAYAQWPSKTIYDETPEHVSYNDIRQQFIATISGIKILYQMDSVDDLLNFKEG